MRNQYPLNLIIETDRDGDETKWLEAVVADDVVIRLELLDGVQVYDQRDRHHYYTDQAWKQVEEILYMRKVDKD